MNDSNRTQLYNINPATVGFQPKPTYTQEQPDIMEAIASTSASLIKARNISFCRKTQQIDLIEDSAEDQPQSKAKDKQSIHTKALYNLNQMIEIDQSQHNQAIEIDSHISYSTPVSQYYPEEEDLSEQDKTLNSKSYNLRIKDLMIISKDEYQKKGVYSGIFKIKKESITTKLQMKEQIVNQRKYRSKKQEHSEGIQNLRMMYMSQGKVKVAHFRSKLIVKEKRGRRSGVQNVRRCKKME